MRAHPPPATPALTRVGFPSALVSDDFAWQRGYNWYAPALRCVCAASRAATCALREGGRQTVRLDVCACATGRRP